MKNQIEEMAKDIKLNRQITPNPKEDPSHQLARLLINDGWRKSSDVARDIFEEIESIIRKHDERPKYQLMLDLAELKKKYTEGK